MTANGTLADNQLVSFYGVRLAPQAAADAGRMVNAAALAGFVIRPLVVKDAASGYRSTGVQAAMRYAQAHGHAAEYDLLPSPPAPPLAPVGESRHGQGRACDWVWQSSGAFAWLLAHGPSYNWRFWDLGRDKPHMEHDSIAHDVVTWTEPGLAPASNGETPLSETTMSEEDEEMTNQPITLEILNHDGSKQWAMVYVVEKVWIPIWTAPAANALSTAFKTLIPVNKVEWNGYRAQCGLPADTTVGV